MLAEYFVNRFLGFSHCKIMRKVFFMPTQKIKERTASMQSATAAQLNSSFPEAT